MRGWVNSKMGPFLCGPFYISRVGSVVHHHSLTDFTRGKKRKELLTKEIMVSVKVAFIVIAFLAVCIEQTDAAMGMYFVLCSSLDLILLVYAYGFSKYMHDTQITVFLLTGFRCCRTYMKGRLPFAIIKGYSVQTITELCPINAIM